MASIKKYLNERRLHQIFEIGLIFKGLIALIEIIGGILVYFISKKSLLEVVFSITQGELSEDPNDFIARYLIHSTQDISTGSQHFAAFFLLSHGIIKMYLIVGLLRERIWYYPAAILIFGLFSLYQLYRFSFTHSVWLLILTFVDVIVIWLTWHEWNYLRRKLVSKSNA